MTTLTVRRERGWFDKMRKYRIMLDGVEIGELANGAELREQITDGPHVIEAKIDWCGSEPLHIQAQSEDITVLVRSALRGWRLVFASFYVKFNGRGYLIVEPAQ